MSELPLPREIRCVLVPVGNLRLLLPNATVAEVITLPTPEPIEGAPEWLLGRIAWRGWRVPLLSFSTLAGASDGDSEQAVRVAVLKALGGHAELPFVAVITQGFPRLTTLNAELSLDRRAATKCRRAAPVAPPARRGRPFPCAGCVAPGAGPGNRPRQVR
jgi:chemosensory pili system protein ChpC